MTTRGTTHRTIRIDDGLWEAAKAKAEEEGRNLSEIIREALREYAETPSRNGPPVYLFAT